MNIRRLLFILFSVLGMLLPQGGALATQAASTVDVRIWTQDANGQPVYDVCYQLANYSLVGCDENLDGNVLFEDIPFGTYEVVPSYSTSSNYRLDPFTIVVNAFAMDFIAVVQSRNDVIQQGPPMMGMTDLYLITRDPKTGDALTGACYELVGYSNVGCDENNDGRVSFEDIPYSTYTIRQVTTPAGHQPMDDYIVSIMPTDVDGPVSLLLVQAPTQAPKDRYNVSVVFVDANTGRLVMNPRNCAQLRGENGPITLRGCDDGIVDGQVDLVHVEYDAENGSDVNVALACPYVIEPGAEPQLLWVGQSSLFLYVHIVDSHKPCS